MKNLLQKTTTILSIAALFATQNASAQDEAGTFLKSGVDDGNKLINAYMSPLMKGFGQGLNDGWYNTAKPLGTGGFDIRFNLGASQVPSSDQSYNINNIGLNTDPNKPRLVLPSGTNPNQPTLFGDKNSTPPEARIVAPGLAGDTTIAKFPMPTGTGFAFTPSLPMIQLSVGIVKKTEVSIRFFPGIKVGDFKASIFGLGIKHDLKQWIAPIKDQPWDWSVFAGFTTFNTEYVVGSLLTVDTAAYNPDPSVKYDNQKMTFSGTAFTIGTMVSKKLGPITPYIGINYAYSKVNMKFEGDFPVTVPNDQFATHPQVTKIQKATDPINIEGTLSNVRANIGLRLKLTILTISGEYSLGKYNTATLGIGLNLQSIKPFKL